jgi:hypothetical protein
MTNNIDKIIYLSTSDNKLSVQRKLLTGKKSILFSEIEYYEQLNDFIPERGLIRSKIEVLNIAKERGYNQFVIVTEAIKNIPDFNVFNYIIKSKDYSLLIDKLQEQLITFRENIPGIILVTSCHKYINSRLKKYGFKNDIFHNWKIHIVMGDPNLKREYELRDNIIILKCEDSYIHLIKKVGLGMKVLNELYNIEQGILRCGDDLNFNERLLKQFLDVKNKTDYIGRALVSEFKMNRFMAEYFETHPQDFENEINGLQNISLQQIQKASMMPRCVHASGVILYLSKKAVKILIEELEKVKYNIFAKENYQGVDCYPYTIEDIGIGYIMEKSGIQLKNFHLYSDNSNQNHIAYHTNEYK